MKPCKCKACNQKRLIKKIKIPKGYKWLQTNNTGEFLEIIFIKPLQRG